MSLKRTATVLATLLGVGIIFVGGRFLLDPTGAAAGFGVPSWPHGQSAAYLQIKGVRDIVSGLIPLALLAAGQRRALGWALLFETLTPLSDMIIVLTHGGPAVVAFSIHGATAAVVLLTAVLLLRERPARVTP
jgi:hypothetical protein